MVLGRINLLVFKPKSDKIEKDLLISDAFGSIGNLKFEIFLLGLFAVTTVLWALFLRVYFEVARNAESSSRNVLNVVLSDNSEQQSATSVAEMQQTNSSTTEPVPLQTNQSQSTLDRESRIVEQAEAPLQSGEHQREPVPSNTLEIIEQTIEHYSTTHPDSFQLPDESLSKYKPNNVFDSKLSNTIAEIRQKKEERRQKLGPDLEEQETYVDVHGRQHYRVGDVCFELIEIPHSGAQWYGKMCGISRNQIDFKFTPEKQFEYQEAYYAKSRGGK